MYTLQTRQQLYRSANHWQTADKVKDLLYSQKHHMDDIQLIESADVSLSQLEADFIQASKKRFQWKQKLKIGLVTALVLLTATSTTTTLIALKAEKQSGYRIQFSATSH